MALSRPALLPNSEWTAMAEAFTSTSSCRGLSATAPRSKTVAAARRRSRSQRASSYIVDLTTALWDLPARRNDTLKPACRDGFLRWTCTRKPIGLL
ncbi:hypothetical protein AQJ46_43585 [Streptomyces canus]|uniref:Uncharacterized protein n=1 Tax=Streptomyces canus TaxID=58343 RepID=A0A101RMC6_9ACTN|nr:hypothetical protein AQJ46_43585 [Streptomyces canus]